MGILLEMTLEIDRFEDPEIAKLFGRLNVSKEDVDSLSSEVLDYGGADLKGCLVGLLEISGNGSTYRSVAEGVVGNLAGSRGMEFGGEDIASVSVGVEGEYVWLKSAGGKMLLVVNEIYDEENDEIGVRFVWQKGGGVLAYADIVVGTEEGFTDAMAYFCYQAASSDMKFKGNDLTMRGPIVDEFAGFFLQISLSVFGTDGFDAIGLFFV